MSKDKMILVAEKSKIMREIDSLLKKVEGLELSIGLLEDSRETGKKEGVRDILLNLVNEAGDKGLNAPAAISAARDRGIKLHKPTVSSLLSRMKKDRLLSFDGNVYHISPSYVNGKEAH